MSKIFDVEKMYGQDFSIVTTNAPSNVIKNSEINLLPNIMLISSPEDKIYINNDNNYPSLFVTDYNANPLQLTYPLYFKNGLSKSEEYGYAYINIDNKTITTNDDGTGELYVNTNNLERASIENFGVIKIAEEMGIDRANYKIGNIELPNNSFIDINEDGIIYLSNNFFELIGDIITKQVKEKVDNIKLILNNNLRIWIEITDTNISDINDSDEMMFGSSVYNLNTTNSDFNISAKNITTLTFNLKYLSFYNDSENVRFIDISEHNIYKIEYNGSNIINQNILTSVEEYNDDLFLHSINNISLTFLPNYYIDEYNLNNNEEYILSIEFTNNSSHPIEKLVFKQPQLFDTSERNKFKINLTENTLPIQDILNNKTYIIFEEITNNIFNNIKENGTDITKYYIYTYIILDDVKYPLIDKQEYILNSENIAINYNTIKSIVSKIKNNYLIENEDNWEIISNQNIIDTIDNSINIICEFIININNKEYIYTYKHPMTLLLIKSLLYGIFIDKNEYIQNSNKIKQYFLNTSNHKLSEASKYENLEDNLNNRSISLSTFIGIINDDLLENNGEYILNYNININNVYTFETNNENESLIEYNNYTENFIFKNNYENLDIQSIIQDDGLFYISLQPENQFSNIIQSFINGIELETQYGDENSTIKNNIMKVYLNILDIILKGVEIESTNGISYKLSDKYNFKYEDLYNMNFGNNNSPFKFNSTVEADNFKKITITIPNYIKYLLNITNNNTDENRFGIQIKYAKNQVFLLEIWASGTGYDYYTSDTSVTSEDDEKSYKVTIINDQIIIEGNALDKTGSLDTRLFPPISNCIFTVKNVNKSNAMPNDDFFEKAIEFNKTTDNIQWEGFVYTKNN